MLTDYPHLIISANILFARPYSNILIHFLPLRNGSGIGHMISLSPTLYYSIFLSDCELKKSGFDYFAIFSAIIFCKYFF